MGALVPDKRDTCLPSWTTFNPVSPKSLSEVVPS